MCAFEMLSPSRGPRARRGAARHGLKPLLLAMSLAGLVGPALAAGPTVADNQLPTGMTLVRGNVETDKYLANTDTNVGTLTQTSGRTVWTATDFSVGAAAAFNVQAAKSDSDTLIRVIGGTPSGIYGSVTANNRLWLVNGAGLYVGPKGSISATNVMLSARDIDPAAIEGNYKDFVDSGHLSLTVGAGANDFSGGYIELAQGALVSATGGNVVMMAPVYIYNAGTITAASGGTVALRVGHDAEVQVGDSGFISLAAPSSTVADNPYGSGRALYNTGTIEADDGHIDLLVAGTGNSGVPLSTDPTNQNYRYINGLVNDGTVRAASSDGHSTIALTTLGTTGGFVINAGVIDASGNPEAVTSKGGTITLAGQMVMNSGSILADGAAGGGQIDLVGNTSYGGSVSVNSDSMLSADATTAGQGGVIRVLGDANVQNDAAAVNTSTATALQSQKAGGGTYVQILGTVRARGGTESGNGGTVVVAGRVVSTHVEGDGVKQAAAFDVSARAATGAHGWLKLYSPEWFLGNYDATTSALVDYSGSALNDTDLSTWLTQGSNVEVGTYALGANTVALHVLDGTKVSSAFAGSQHLKLTSVKDVELGTQNAPAGITIESTGGPLHVTVTGDADVDGTGNVQLVGYRAPTAAGAAGRATAQASVGDALVNIDTRGGNIDITGTVATSGQETSGQAVLIKTAQLTAQGGQVNITGGVHANMGESNGYRRQGVVITDTRIDATDILIHGRGFNNNGVNLQGAALNLDHGVLAINGEAYNTGESYGDGVYIQNAYVNMDGGHMVVLGSASSDAYSTGSGLRVGYLDITATGTNNWPSLSRIIMVGSSTGSSSTGLQVEGEGGAINLHGADGGKTDADLALGASADATQASSAIELGSSYFNTTGRVGVRPVSYTDGPMFDLVDQPIYLGVLPDVSNFFTNFIVTPDLFNGIMGQGLNIIVGSNLHKGLIRVGDQVFNGQTVVTLQNQGAGASGIELGAQGGLNLNTAAPGRAQALAANTSTAGTFNLVTTGNVSQTGPITADAVNVVAGPSSNVDLSNPDNHIGSLLVNGGSTVNVPQSATPASTSTVYAYDANNNSFVTISATNGRTSQTDTTGAQQTVAPSRATVESTDVLNETRTDVYVRGQVTRPQVCTPANTGGGAFDPSADPLAQQWLQVRRSAQLSSCSSVRSDSNCSAF